MKFWAGVSFTDPTHLTRLAKKAEELGFEGVFMGDHLFFPEQLATRYPYTENRLPPWDASTPFPDAWCAISAMAAVTERLRFTPSPLHSEEDLDTLMEVTSQMEGTTICVLSDSVAAPVQSSITKFREEYLARIRTGEKLGVA